MTKFETIGINYQYDANNIKEANRSFRYSCNCCCHKGIHLSYTTWLWLTSMTREGDKANERLRTGLQ